jgi:hypothetical protein
VPIIQQLGKLRQKDPEFQASLSYIGETLLVSKTKTNKPRGMGEEG